MSQELQICVTCKDETTEYWTSWNSKGEVTKYECDSCVCRGRIKDYEETGYLTSKLIMEANLATHKYNGSYYRDEQPSQTHINVAEACKRLEVSIRAFQTNVWFNGMKTQINAEKRVAGMSASHDSFKILTFCTAGRCMLTLEEANVSLSIVADETSDISNIGLQSCYGTEKELLSLLAKSQLLFAEDKLNLIPDNKISII